MRWRKTTLERITDRLLQLGLNTCAVCGTGALSVDRRPILMEIGGTFEREYRTGVKDAEHNLIFVIAVKCELCGHVLFFDSERFTGSNEKTLITGLTHEEEAQFEAEQAEGT